MKGIQKIIRLLCCCCLLQGLCAQEKEYKIGILLDINTTAIDSLMTELENEIKATVGQDANVLFPKESILVNNYDKTVALQQYNQLLENDTDIVLALGVIIGHVVSELKIHKKPTILLGAVNKDMGLIDFDQKTSGIENFTYLLEQDSYQEDLETLYKLTGFGKVGIIIEEEFADVLPIKETFERITREMNVAYTLVPLKTLDSMVPYLDDVDAVYIAGGFYLSNSELHDLSELFIEKRLPSFTINNAKQVQSGIMATRNARDNYDNMLRRVALTVQRYVSGVALSEQSVLVDTKARLLFNYNTADAIEVPMRYSMVNDTEFIGDLTNANPEAQYSLQQAIEKALDKNVALKAVDRSVALQNQEVKTAKNDYLPLLTANAGVDYQDPDIALFGFGLTPELQTSGNIALEQTVFSESVNANMTIQKHLLAAEREKYNTEELNTIFNVANAYFDILIGKANAGILRSNMETTRKNLTIAEQNYEAGISGKADILRLQSELAQNTQLVVEAINEVDQRFIQLNQLLNNPVNTKIDIEDVSLDVGLLKTLQYTDFNELLDNPNTRAPFVVFLKQEAIKNAPELKVLGHSLKATERTIRLNGSGRFLPTLGLRAQYNTIFNRSGEGSAATDGLALPDTNYNASLVVSIPIFNRNQTNISRQTARIQKEQLNLDIENNELSIGANVNNSILNVINQMTNMDLSILSEKAASQSLSLTQSSYAAGAVNIVQLIDAQRNYLNARLNETTAIYSYLLSVLQVERSIGYFFMMQPQKANKALIAKFLNTQEK